MDYNRVDRTFRRNFDRLYDSVHALFQKRRALQIQYRDHVFSGCSGSDLYGALFCLFSDE